MFYVSPRSGRPPRWRWGRLAALVVALFVLSLAGVLLANRAGSSTKALQRSSSRQAGSSSPAASSQVVGGQSITSDNFNSQQYSLDDPASPWIVVDKRRPLQPKEYTPDVAVPDVALRLGAGNGEMHVSRQMVPALEQLFAAAAKANVPLRLASGYRSYQEQVSVYANEVKSYGQAQADRESARPGYSEHQTGLAADLEPLDRSCEITQCFATTPAGQWLAGHAVDYGFIIRYGNGQENTTGYMYEPWHVRYVGTGLAREIAKRGNPPLESFFSLPAAPDYQ